MGNRISNSGGKYKRLNKIFAFLLFILKYLLKVIKQTTCQNLFLTTKITRSYLQHSPKGFQDVLQKILPNISYNLTDQQVKK